MPNGTKHMCEKSEQICEGQGKHWHLLSDALPEVGSKFIALYADGSGSMLFFRHDEGFIDGDGDDHPELSDSLYEWAYLPKGFQLWCENTSEPMTLPEWGGAPSSAGAA